jgi:hypothetical protein
MSTESTSAHSNDANSQASDGVSEAISIDNLQPFSDRSSLGAVSFVASENAQHTVNTLHARVEALESKAAEGMEMLAFIQQDVTTIKQDMVGMKRSMEKNIANVQARYENLFAIILIFSATHLIFLSFQRNESLHERPVVASSGCRRKYAFGLSPQHS